MFRILLICTGNTCRSPMAEHLLRHKIRQAGLEDAILVLSAGVATIDGLTASDHAIETLRQSGIDLITHRSRQLSPELVKAADLVLTMTRGHKQAVIAMLPGHAAKVHTLGEFAEPSELGDVLDPFGGTLSVYQSAAEHIDKLLEKSWSRIVELAGIKG